MSPPFPPQHSPSLSPLLPPVVAVVLAAAVAAGGGCATTSSGVVELDQAPAEGGYGVAPLGIAAGDVSVKRSIQGIAMRDAVLADMAADSLNRFVGAKRDARGVSTTIDIDEKVDGFFSTDNFTMELRSTLPDGSTVTTSVPQTNVGTAGDTALSLGIFCAELGCLLPVTVFGAMAPFYFVGIIPAIASIVLAIPGIGLLLCAPSLNDHTKDRSARASALFHDALAEHAAALRPKLAALAKSIPAESAPPASAAPPPVPVLRWYYVDGEGKRAGPVLEAELLELARRHVIGGGTLVWHDGMVAWTPIDGVASLRAQLTPNNPAEPPPVP